MTQLFTYLLTQRRTVCHAPRCHARSCHINIGLLIFASWLSKTSTVAIAEISFLFRALIAPKPYVPQQNSPHTDSRLYFKNAYNRCRMIHVIWISLTGNDAVPITMWRGGDEPSSWDARARHLQYYNRPGSANYHSGLYKQARHDKEPHERS